MAELNVLLYVPTVVPICQQCHPSIVMFNEVSVSGSKSIFVNYTSTKHHYNSLCKIIFITSVITSSIRSETIIASVYF